MPVTEERLRKVVLWLEKIKKAKKAQLSNWEVDEYYERYLKKFDME